MLGALQGFASESGFWIVWGTISAAIIATSIAFRRPKDGPDA